MLYLKSFIQVCVYDSGNTSALEVSSKARSKIKQLANACMFEFAAKF